MFNEKKCTTQSRLQWPTKIEKKTKKYANGKETFFLPQSILLYMIIASLTPDSILTQLQASIFDTKLFGPKVL